MDLYLAYVVIYMSALTLITLIPICYKSPKRAPQVDLRNYVISSPLDCLVWDKIVSESDREMLSTIRVLLGRCKADVETIQQVNLTTINQVLGLLTASTKILDEVESKISQLDTFYPTPESSPEIMAEEPEMIHYP